MFYGTIAITVFLISALTILMQLILLPIFFKHTGIIRYDIEERMKLFELLADIGDMNLAEKRRDLLRRKKSTSICPPPEFGLPGLPGDPGEDGEQGDDGSIGLPGKSTLELLDEIQQQCVICPQGERGPPGAPGNQGIQGPKGDRGIPGIPGSDGQDGEIGLEGVEGYNGTSGMRGPKGPDGKPATGGIGKPGPKGLPGSIGRTGPQGPRGRRNYVYGPPGPDGKKGVKGMDGLPGNFGPRGSRGPIGESGANAIFCPCPLEMKLLDGKHAKKSRQLTKVKKKKKNEILSESSTYAPIIIDDASNEISNIKSKQTFILPSNIQYENMPQQLLPETSLLSTIIEYDKITNDEENDDEDSMDQKIKTSIRTDDDDDDDNDGNDKPLLYDNANSGFEDITIVHNDHNRNETKIQINSLTRLQHSDETNQQQPASKILPIINNHENTDQIADLRHTEYDDEHSANIEEQGEQKISGINKNDIHRSHQLNDIANYLTYNRRIAVGDTEDNENKQILSKIHRQRLLNEDEGSKISIIKNERAKLTIATTTTNAATTISGSLITGYPDETSSSTRRRFIYVTKRPISR